jgi:hypothetical protein
MKCDMSELQQDYEDKNQDVRMEENRTNILKNIIDY